ncbi:MAG TPA: ATP-grasp domain-containing protein [Polyangia bacterium]|nr:ATP-grasp domain-containing protein [Polyangia bacterium]
MAPRVLVLSSTTSYRTDDFLRAAVRLGVEAVLGTNRCHELAGLWPREAFGGSVPIEFRHEAEAADAIVREAERAPFAAIVPTDDATADIAARAAERLGLRGNSVGAATTARNKRLMREALARGGVAHPRFAVFDAADEPARAWGELAAAGWQFPVVVKPLLCSASRGVIRADDVDSLAAAWWRLHALLQTPALRAVEDPDGQRVLVEAFVPGDEVALEGILRDGLLTPLALFDKPDPLDGPYFEETIYVTPSRHPATVQRAIERTAAMACAAIGLRHGPVHAELRVGPDGPVMIEVAARSIGGLCARTLRFGLGATSLEEIVIASALGRELGSLARSGAAGVMMIPIPAGGVLGEVRGVDAARAVPLVEDVQVTARPGEVLVPLPEGAAYLGFIFARGEAPEAVEAALREAHARLSFDVSPLLPKLR